MRDEPAIGLADPVRLQGAVYAAAIRTRASWLNIPVPNRRVRRAAERGDLPAVLRRPNDHRRRAGAP